MLACFQNTILILLQNVLRDVIDVTIEVDAWPAFTSLLARLHIPQLPVGILWQTLRPSLGESKYNYISFHRQAVNNGFIAMFANAYKKKTLFCDIVHYIHNVHLSNQ